MMLASRLGCPFSLKTANMGNPGYHEAEAKALLGIPKDTGTACLVLLGYLAQSEHFGGAGRPHSRRHPLRPLGPREHGEETWD